MNRDFHRHNSIREVLLAAASLTALTLGTSAALAAPDLTVVAPTPEIVIASPGTPSTDISPGVNGIGQMVVDERNGFIGLCTGTLINPRTVLFAGHCVNSQPASAYGANTGGYPIGFFFNSNNNVRGNSAIGQWLNGVSGGPKDQTNTANYAYNVNYVAYNPASALPGNTFLYSDIAVATLDHVAANVPTWPVLFSPLPVPAQITAAGTGYHVTIEGYGTKGAGAAGGNGGIDFQRRVANNTIGALTSLNNFEGFLFGATDNLPQNLYFVDFDDPNRGTANASPYDFNALRDNAVPNEGITGPGDSGGPLILDTTFSKQVVIGTLSGGYAAFFNGQPSYSYGAVSFYQPVYLYWDWIAANDHYHYTGALPGSGSWTDPAHWAARLDPNFTVIQGGVLVNGIPNAPGGGTSDTSGQFGQICYQDPSGSGFSDCYDVHTGIETISNNQPIGTSATGSAAARASNALLSPVSPTPDGPSGLPLPTLYNGLPGATNFVPNNIDSAGGSVPQYFDVTLDQSGTTTLSAASAVIDNLTLNNNAGLNIAPDGSLTVNIGAGQYAASTLNVDGTLTTSDYVLAGGLLTGTGTINLGAGGTVFPSATKLLTLGAAAFVSPGTTTSVGTLTVNGNVFFGPSAVYTVNTLGAATDKLTVSGLFGAYGNFVYTPLDKPYWHQGGVIVQAGQIVGTAYTVPDTLSGVLYPAVTLQHMTGYDVLVLSVEAQSLLTQFTPSDQNEISVASLLDTDRAGSYSALQSVYQNIDTLSGGALQGAIDQLKPNQQFGFLSLGHAGLNVIGNLLNGRLGSLRFSDGAGGTGFAFNGADPVAQSLSQSLTLGGGSGGQNPLVAALSAQSSPQGASGAPASVTPAQAMFGDRIGGFVSAAGISGSADYNGQSKNITGYAVMGGLDTAIAPRFILGAAMAYTDTSADLVNYTGRSKLQSYQGTLYGNWSDEAQDFFANGYAGYGGVSGSSTRFANLGGTILSAMSSPSGDQVQVGANAGLKAAATSWLNIYPQAGIEYENFHTDAYSETGSAIAMSVAAQTTEQLIVRVGGEAAATWKIDDSWTVYPALHVFFALDANHDQGQFVAGFAGAPGATALFANPYANSWIELGGGVETKVGDNMAAGISYDVTTQRAEASYGAVSGHLRFSF